MKGSLVGEQKIRLVTLVALRGCADRRQRQRARVVMLQAEERGIAAVAAEQIVMPPALDDLSILYHQNGVGVHDGMEAMGDDDGGAVLAEVFDRLLHLFFGF